MGPRGGGSWSLLGVSFFFGGCFEPPRFWWFVSKGHQEDNRHWVGGMGGVGGVGGLWVGGGRPANRRHAQFLWSDSVRVHPGSLRESTGGKSVPRNPGQRLSGKRQECP